ncbi:MULTISPECIES: IS21 family transposase [unclassified Pseudomonas]|uniref:IS21 family transposase n=1 Tax=unclassified Pseudomonas TaxID=196821 RepID=UPI0030DC3755
MIATGEAFLRPLRGEIMKLSVDEQREILRIASSSTLSNRAIAQVVQVSHNTVRALRDQLVLSGESWESLKTLDNATFSLRFNYERRAPTLRKVVPQWHEIHEQLRFRDMTLDLLWQEFREKEPDGVSYAQFTRHYRAWVKTQKISMRQVHIPGDKMFVDFCGRTMPITDPDTGEITSCQVFVGALGSSGYLFAIAVASQTTQNWLRCHIEALEHFDGVPRFVVPDNLKAAVIKTTRNCLILNKAYSELSEHYGFTITPSRPRKPKDKSLAEVGVQIVQRFVLARLRNRTFFSLDELNQQITYWMEQLNQRVTRTYPKSRLARFQETDAPALQALPERQYSYSQWVYQVRIGGDYHVEFQGRSYSVPYHHANQLVDLRVNADWLEVTFQRRVISSHRIDTTPGVSTLREHLAPNHHQFQDSQPPALLAWAADIGPETHLYVQRNLEDRRDFATGLRAVTALKRDVRKEQIPHQRLESACAYANSLGIVSSERLRAILRNGSDLRRPPMITTPTIEHSNIRGATYYAAQEEKPV